MSRIVFSDPTWRATPGDIERHPCASRFPERHEPACCDCVARRTVDSQPRVVCRPVMHVIGDRLADAPGVEAHDVELRRHVEAIPGATRS